MTTLVVPSPTFSSCERLSSIMLLAAGCLTSTCQWANERASAARARVSKHTHSASRTRRLTSRKIAWPSFVIEMPPLNCRFVWGFFKKLDICSLLQHIVREKAWRARVVCVRFTHHRIEHHFQHRFRTEAGANRVGDSLAQRQPARTSDACRTQITFAWRAVRLRGKRQRRAQGVHAQKNSENATTTNARTLRVELRVCAERTSLAAHMRRCVLRKAQARSSTSALYLCSLNVAHLRLMTRLSFHFRVCHLNTPQQQQQQIKLERKRKIATTNI